MSISNSILSIFLLSAGSGIVFIWSADIFKGEFIDPGNFFTWKNEAEDLLWPHILAEFTTAILLIVSGILIITGKNEINTISHISLGALAYTSLNSLSWSLAKKDRYVYAVPMVFCFICSIYFILILI